MVPKRSTRCSQGLAPPIAGGLQDPSPLAPSQIVKKKKKIRTHLQVLCKQRWPEDNSKVRQKRFDTTKPWGGKRQRSKRGGLGCAHPHGGMRGARPQLHDEPLFETAQC